MIHTDSNKTAQHTTLTLIDESDLAPVVGGVMGGCIPGSLGEAFERGYIDLPGGPAPGDPPGVF